MSIVRRQTQTMVKRTWLLSGRTRRLGRRCSCRGRRYDTVTQLGAVQPSVRCERRGDRVLSPIEHKADCLLPQRLRPSRRRSRHRAASPPGAHPPCTCPSACGRRGPYRRLITIPRRLDGRRSRSRRRVLRSPFLFERAGGGRRCTLSDRGPRRRRRGERWTRRRVDAPKLLGRGARLSCVQTSHEGQLSTSLADWVCSMQGIVFHSGLPSPSSRVPSSSSPSRAPKSLGRAAVS